METCQVWHLSFQLSQLQRCIYFVSQQDRLLFMNLTFVGTYLDKEFITRYSATLFMDGRSVRIVVTIVIVATRLTGYRYLCTMRGNGFAMDFSVSGGNRECSGLVGIESICVCYG